MQSKQGNHDPAALTNELLTKIEVQLRLLVRCQLLPVYTSMVGTADLQKLYAATGKKPVVQLAKEFGMSTGKISMLWQKWEQAGLLLKQGAQYIQTI